MANVTALHDSLMDRLSVETGQGSRITHMRSRTLRTLTLAAALVVMAVPVFSHSTASACDVGFLNNCTSSTTVSVVGDTNTSPLTFTVSSVAASEVTLAGETTYTVPMTIGIGIADLRGNNSGFLVQLEALPGIGPGAMIGNTPLTIPATDYYLINTLAFNGQCVISAPGGNCSAISPIVFPGPVNLGTFRNIACADFLANGAEGYGAYGVAASMQLRINPTKDPFLDEVYGTNPKEWVHRFVVQVLTGQIAAAAAAGVNPPCLIQ
jgi:hypothetical protein